MPITTTTTTTILHVTRGKVFLGEIALDEHDRVRHADPGLPRDVVLKTLVEYSRGEGWFGTVPGCDGKKYRWRHNAARQPISELTPVARRPHPTRLKVGSSLPLLT
jgi:hypothetical protein